MLCRRTCACYCQALREGALPTGLSRDALTDPVLIRRMFMFSNKQRIFILMLAVATAAHAESIWTINSAKVRPGMIEKARRYYDAAWLPARREAVRLGYIKSFRLLAVPEESKTDAEFVLITEYESQEKFAVREKNFQSIFEQINTPRPLRVDGLGRDEIFESVKGMENYQDITPAAMRKP